MKKRLISVLTVILCLGITLSVFFISRVETKAEGDNLLIGVSDISVNFDAASAGKYVTVTVYIENASALEAMTFFVKTPAGLKFGSVSTNCFAPPMGVDKDDYICTAGLQEKNILGFSYNDNNVACSFASASPLTSPYLEILEITFEVAKADFKIDDAFNIEATPGKVYVWNGEDHTKLPLSGVQKSPGSVSFYKYDEFTEPAESLFIAEAVDAENATIKEYVGSGYSNIKIPDEIIINDGGAYDGMPLPVTKLDNGAFEGKQEITHISVPASVTEIDERAFKNLNGLKAFDCDEKDMVHKFSAKKGALYDNTADKKLLAYPAGKLDKGFILTDGDAAYIAEYAFNGAKNLEFIYLPKSFKGPSGIKDDPGSPDFRTFFTGCVNLKNVFVDSEFEKEDGIGYFSDDGVLYYGPICLDGNPDGEEYVLHPETLSFYPPARENSVYAVLDGVTSIEGFAVLANVGGFPGGLKLIIPESVTGDNIKENAIGKKISSFDAGNNTFRVEDDSSVTVRCENNTQSSSVMNYCRSQGINYMFFNADLDRDIINYYKTTGGSEAVKIIDYHGTEFKDEIKYNGQLVDKSDYTFSNDTVTFSQNYLRNLPFGKQSFELYFSFDDGADTGRLDPPHKTVTFNVVTNSTLPENSIRYISNEENDRAITVALNGNTLTGIRSGATVFVAGTDYSADYSTGVITLKKAFFNKLGTPRTNVAVTFMFSNNTEPQTINVTTLNNAQLTVSRNSHIIGNSGDITVNFNLNGYTFSSITGNGITSSHYDLIRTGNIFTGYTTVGITIKAAYLNGLSAGAKEFTVNFSGGDSKKFTITMIRSASLNPASATYVKGNTDVRVNFTLNGHTFTSIAGNGITGSDYNVSGSLIDIKASYLDTLSRGNKIFTVNFSGGNPQTLTISVVESAKLTPASATISRGAAKDITITFTLNGLKFKDIAGLKGGFTTAGTPDYVYNNLTKENSTAVTLKASYLNKLPEGTTKITVSFNGGDDQTFTITVNHVHAFGNWAATEAPTCGAGGIDTRKCSCGATETRTVNATGSHTYSTWNDAGGGNEESACTICGNISSRKHATLKQTDLTYVKGSNKEITIDFTLNGLTFSSVTGNSIASGSYTEVKTGSIFNRVTTSITLTPAYLNTLSEGAKTFTVNFSGGSPKKFTVTVETSTSPTTTQPPTAATTEPPTTADPTKPTASAPTGQHDHEYGSWIVTNIATCSSPGERSRQCRICGEYDRQAVPVTNSHNYGDWQPDGEGFEKRACPACGKSERRAAGDTTPGSITVINNITGNTVINYITEISNVSIIANAGGASAVADVSAGSTVDGFKNNVNEKEFIKLFNKDGSEAENGAELSTGMTARLIAGETEKYKVLIVVKGDVTGTGDISASDARAVLRHAAKLTILENEFLAAADVNYDNEVDASDARVVLRFVAKLQQMPEKPE